MRRKLYSFENFDIDVNSSSMLIIIIGISVGLLIGIALSLVCRVVSGKFIKALKNAEAVDENSAKTIAELGLSKMLFAKTMLKPDSALFRAVGCVGGFTGESAGGFKKFWHEKFIKDDTPVKFDFNEAKFYLPEEKRVSAELRFIEEKHPLRSFVLSAVLITAVCVFAIYAVPELLTMFDNLLTQLSA